MKCPTCGIESRTVIQENERLFDKDIYLKDRLAPTYVLIFSFIFDSHTQISYKLVFVFMISMLFYWMLLSKVSYYSAFTVMGKLGSVALNVCGVIFSFVFSYAAILYMIGLQDPIIGFLYFWSGVFVLGSIMSKSLVL